MIERGLASLSPPCRPAQSCGGDEDRRRGLRLSDSKWALPWMLPWARHAVFFAIHRPVEVHRHDKVYRIGRLVVVAKTVVQPLDWTRFREWLSEFVWPYQGRSMRTWHCFAVRMSDRVWHGLIRAIMSARKAWILSELPLSG